MIEWKPDSDGEEREILAARLTGVPGPGGVNPAAELLMDELRAALARADERRQAKGKKAMPRLLSEGLPSVTGAAADAVAGTLRSKGLDGALKEAHIMVAYAEARERNANADKAAAEAEKASAEAQQARIAAAREGLALVVETFAAAGINPAIALTQGGMLTVLLGEALTSDVPQISAAVDAELENGGK